jgi:hypothetical protein
VVGLRRAFLSVLRPTVGPPHQRAGQAQPPPDGRGSGHHHGLTHAHGGGCGDHPPNTGAGPGAGGSPWGFVLMMAGAILLVGGVATRRRPQVV